MELMDQQTHSFHPLVSEQFGTLGVLANDFMESLAYAQCARQFGLPASAPRDQITSHPHFNRVFVPLITRWRRLLSVTLMRGNAECILRGARNATGDLDIGSVVGCEPVDDVGLAQRYIDLSAGARRW